MRRSRTALGLLLTALAGSFLAIGGVNAPRRSTSLPRRIHCGTPALGHADLCSTYARLHGPSAPLALPTTAGDQIDWAGLCADSRHSIGNQEILQINEHSGGLCEDRTAQRADELALAASCFAGPRGACVVSERSGGAAYMADRKPNIGPVLVRFAAAIAKRVLDTCQGPTLTVLQAARQSTGRAIGVGLTGASPIPDRAAGLWLYEPPRVAGSIRL